MKNIENIFKNKKILLCDGAMGTELLKKGAESGSCLELLNITNRKVVYEVHTSYVEAGSDIIETNTFGANKIRLKGYGLSDKAAELNKKGVEIAREASQGKALIAASIGPIGEPLEPFGDIALDEAYNAFYDQASALKEAGTDFIFIETMSALDEAEIALKACKDAVKVPISVTMTFEAGREGIKTNWGVDIAAAVDRLTLGKADLIGANCGRGFDEMLEVVKEMKNLTNKPIIAQANAGLPEYQDGKVIYKETPESVAEKAEFLIKFGVSIIGGCCGSGPEHIKAIRKIIDNNTL